MDGGPERDGGHSGRAAGTSCRFPAGTKLPDNLWPGEGSTPTAVRMLSNTEMICRFLVEMSSDIRIAVRMSEAGMARPLLELLSTRVVTSADAVESLFVLLFYISKAAWRTGAYWGGGRCGTAGGTGACTWRCLAGHQRHATVRGNRSSLPR